MIYISQGHQDSIALEIFVKSFLLLPTFHKKFFTLVVCENTLEKNLSFLGLNHQYSNTRNLIEISGSELNAVTFNDSKDLPISTVSLNIALEKINPREDILLTLPTSKDQLILNNKKLAGYTEFFRHYFNHPEISMVFSSENEKILLITDHISLRDVPETINSDLIFNKTALTIVNYPTYFDSFDEVIIAGINPHVGENGMLGNEDIHVVKAVARLKEHFKKIKFIGPVSGDTLHFYKNSQKNQLLVYMYHDQGLPVFKAQNGHLGLNISLGLPFLRMSVDHGTAFNLYGKNEAHIFGCLYMLKSAIKAHKKINQKEL